MNRPIEPRLIADASEALGRVFAAGDKSGCSQQSQALNSLLRGVRQPEPEMETEIKPGGMKGKHNVAGSGANKTTLPAANPNGLPPAEEAGEQNEYQNPKD